MKQVIRYQKPSIFRRICSMAFDAIILVSVFVLFLSVLVQPIIANTAQYKKSYQDYINYSVATHLYVETEDQLNGPIIIVSTNDKLVEYYNDNKLNYTIADYNSKKKDAKVVINKVEYNLFYDDGTGNYVEYKAAESETAVNDQLDSERTKWYKSLATSLISEELSGRTIVNADGTKSTFGNEEFQKCARYINSQTILSWIISLIISALFTYLMFPMIFKDRATLGKKMFHFQVINGKTGFIASRFQIFARFVFFALFNIVGAYLTFGLSILISICMACLTKKRTTLHDVLASTLVVNTVTASTSQNPQDYIGFEYDDGRPEPEERDVYSTFSVGEVPTHEDQIIENDVFDDK